jgi:hypothetical protein
MSTLFKSKKSATKTAKLPVVQPEPVQIQDFETESKECMDALVKLVGEDAAAEGLNFIKTQCQNDPDFVKLIFDRDRRNKLVGIVQGFNPAQLFGGIAEKFTGLI